LSPRGDNLSRDPPGPHPDRRYPTAVDFCTALTGQAIEWEPLWGTSPSSIFVVAGDFNQSLPRQGNFGSIKGELAVLDALKRQICFA
jgi:hypothetical protein